MLLPGMHPGRPLLPSAPYLEQHARWPSSGRHILAHFDSETVVVYQAYSREIGHFAIENGCFGGGFGYGRMSWVKPNFLWMMYRSDWGRSPGQEVVLAVRLRRSFFDAILGEAVASSFAASGYANHSDWAAAVQRSSVRLQWDPDHTPTGGKCERRAIQLGLRGQVLQAYGKREALEIIDMSPFVAEQRANVGAPSLVTPVERVYVPSDPVVRARLQLDDS